MKKFVRFLLVATVILCACSVLVACQNSKNKTSETTPPAETENGGGGSITDPDVNEQNPDDTQKDPDEGENNKGEDKTPEKHVHNATEIKAAAATCDKAGNIAYWYCEGCNKYFSDKDCSDVNEITLADTVDGKALGHKNKTSHIAAAPTCDKAGNIAYWYCPDCEKYFGEEACETALEYDAVFSEAPLNHKSKVHNEKHEYCDKEGNIEYWYCPDCNKNYSDEACTTVLEGSTTLSAAHHSSAQHVPAKINSYEEGVYEHWYCPVCNKYFADDKCESEIDYVKTIAPPILQFKQITQTYNKKVYIVSGYNNEVKPAKVVIPAEYDGLPVIGIGEKAFEDCSTLTSITVPASIKYFDSRAFYNCTALTEINYNAASCDDLTEGNYVFYKAGTAGEGISLVIGGDTEKIPAYLFCPREGAGYAPKIKEITFLSDTACSSIGKYAFAYCDSLAALKLPQGIKQLQEGAFANCRNLTNVYFEAIACNDLAVDNKVFANAGISAKGITVTVGASASKIPAYLFYPSTESPKIVKVEFDADSHCEVIGAYAFNLCNTIKDVVLAASIKRIEHDAFGYCRGLESIVIPDKVTEIGDSAFESCSGLTSVTIGNNVSSIGSYAFYGCSKLAEVNNKSDLVIVAGDKGNGYVGYYATAINKIG